MAARVPLRRAAGGAGAAGASEGKEQPALHLLETGAIGATRGTGFSGVRDKVIELFEKNVAQRGGLDEVGRAAGAGDHDS